MYNVMYVSWLGIYVTLKLLSKNICGTALQNTLSESLSLYIAFYIDYLSTKM